MNLDLDAYFDTELPTVTVFGKSYPVDNDYKTVLKARLKYDKPNGNTDPERVMRDFLTDTLKGGRAAADEILAHRMPFSFWNTLELGILAAMTGKTMEELRPKKAASFPGKTGGGKRV